MARLSKIQPQPRRQARVCVFCEMTYGRHERNHHSSAMFALAQFLARRGDYVTLVAAAAPGTKTPDPAAQQALRENYLQRDMIALEFLEASGELYPGLERRDKASLAAYHALRGKSFDVAYFPLEGGLAHFAICAKRTAVFEDPTALVVVANEPTPWAREVNDRFPAHKSELLVDFMEQYSATHCDFLAASSKAALDWMAGAGWGILGIRKVLPPLVTRDWQPQAGSPRKSPRSAVTDIAFFGSADPKDGLSLFCDAIDVLHTRTAAPFRITSLGAFGKILGEHSGAYLLRRARNWRCEVNIVLKQETGAIIRYLAERNCLAVLPFQSSMASLELLACLDSGLPVITTEVGGITELLSPETRTAASCRPDANELAELMAKALVSVPECRPAEPLQKREVSWNAFHEAVLGFTAAKPARPRKRPLVSIITAHYERPELLRQAVFSVQCQDYRNIELIVVDDGSKSAEARAALKALEPEFKRRKWQILRQKNQYLGAARNAGIRAAKGELLLFLDDDNALMPHAVSTLVEAMHTSGADICTTFAWLLNGPNPPPVSQKGIIGYYPTGGAMGMAVLHDPYGDANALIRRGVFDRIGYLNEMRGLSVSDWEFFSRADLAGLKIQVVPEALYWYRVDEASMNKRANFFKNRSAIIEVFQKSPSPALKSFLQLAVATNSDRWEMENNYWILAHLYENAKFHRLSDLDPNSQEALDLLCELAASEGRPDVSLALLAQRNSTDFKKRALEYQGRNQAVASIDVNASSFIPETVPLERLRLAEIRSTDAASDILAYTEASPDRLFLEARNAAISFAVLKRAVGISTLSVRAIASLDEPLSEPAAYAICAIPSGRDPRDAIMEANWQTLSYPLQRGRIEIFLESPANQELDLVLAVRRDSAEPQGRVLLTFSEISSEILSEAARRPRRVAPPGRGRTRAWSDAERKSAHLVTGYPSELPLLLYPHEHHEGLFLRPSKAGPVIASIVKLVPPLAAKVIGQVEVTHEEASPFEFALAVGKPDFTLDWRHPVPTNCVAFSGWVRVEEKFELKDVTLRIHERQNMALNLYLAVRLPRGSTPSPANSYWRSVIMSWDS